VQVTATFVTLPPLTIPSPFLTTHIWLGAVGCEDTVTLYVAPLATGVENVNEPFAEIAVLLPELF
jgi:hypothetical protein